MSSPSQNRLMRSRSVFCRNQEVSNETAYRSCALCLPCFHYLIRTDGKARRRSTRECSKQVDCQQCQPQQQCKRESQLQQQHECEPQCERKPERQRKPKCECEHQRSRG